MLHQHMRMCCRGRNTNLVRTGVPTGVPCAWQVLPSVYLFIGASLHATPAQLGTLTLCRAMVQVNLIRHTFVH